ncbi:hypothetical protein [Azospirillum thermophilum]|uniref:hypothetical protein n=1 Tax=Azospirillum thermophilum TaxID=2202148 RepID=UPI001FEB7EA7|nr:hypothetical protein [Azospirillum thermophilum]
MTMETMKTTQVTHRFGVRAKLLLAFAGMAGMTVAASIVGLTSFSAVQDPLTRIVRTSLPEMELAKKLSGRAAASPRRRRPWTAPRARRPARRSMARS